MTLRMNRLAVVAVAAAGCWTPSRATTETTTTTVGDSEPASGEPYGGASDGGAADARTNPADAPGTLGALENEEAEYDGFGSSTGTSGLRLGSPDSTRAGGLRSSGSNWGARGKISRAIIRQEMRSHSPKLRHCYEKHLVDDPQLQGTVTVTFLITEDGTVSRSIATGMHPEVASCVASIVKTIWFPKPEGGPATVRYPVIFRPQ